MAAFKHWSCTFSFKFHTLARDYILFLRFLIILFLYTIYSFILDSVKISMAQCDILSCPSTLYHLSYCSGAKEKGCTQVFFTEHDSHRYFILLIFVPLHVRGKVC